MRFLDESERRDLEQELVRLATSVLAGKVDLLEAAPKLWSNLSVLGFDWNDPDYHAFGLIVSETDALPLGEQRAQWAPDALVEKEPELREARIWAAPLGMPACERIVTRFGARE
jgi:hypothetical protein